MTPERVECRIPTYRRPELLRRALRALQAQTHENWRAVVLDDSSAGEAASVVRDCGDPRITHRINPAQLGAAGNLDQAFHPEPMAGGRFAFVLEDDNAITPDFISVGLTRLAAGDVDVVSFNQICIRLDEDGHESREGTLRPGQREEIWTTERICLHAFLGASLPNGGYFWRLGGTGLDLTVGPSVVEPQLQECIRQTRVPGALALLPEPASLWSLLPDAQVRRQRVAHRRFAASLNRLSRGIVDGLGRDRFWTLARQHFGPTDLARCEAIMAEIAWISRPRLPVSIRAIPRAGRGLLRAWLHPDPIAPALSHLQERATNSSPIGAPAA